MLRPCFICGSDIAPEDFLEWPDSPGTRFAICGHCGAPNEQHETAFIVDRRYAPDLPAPATDVYPKVGGGWRACCDCGLTEASITQADGWTWVVDHRCMPALDPTT
jgi:hypothetical protein